MEVLKAGLPALDEDTIEKRLAAGRFAQASVGLEGFTVTPSVLALQRRYAFGEITMDEFIAAIPTATAADLGG